MSDGTVDPVGKKGMGSLARIRDAAEDFKEAFVTDTLESLRPEHELAREAVVNSINRMAACKQNWTRAMRALKLEDDDNVDVVAAMMLTMRMTDDWMELLEDMYCDRLGVRRKRTQASERAQALRSNPETVTRSATTKELGISTRVAKYSGTDGICATWFVDFEGIMNMLQAGKAYTTFKQSRPDGWNYDELKEYMVDMFDTKEMKDLSRDLDWIRQQPKEMASDFRLRWEELMSKITQKGTVMTEEFQISILRNRMLRRYDLDVKDFETKGELFKHCIAKDPKGMRSSKRDGKKEDDEDTVMFTLRNGKKVNLATVKCHRCNQMGHFQWMRDKCNKAGSDDGKSEDGEMFMTVKDKGKFDEDIWVNDDAAPWHVCNSREAFVDMDECQGKVLGGDKEYEGVDIAGIGTVRITTESGNQITLNETRYVPSFKTNLISGQRVIDMGCTVRGDKTRLEYMRKGKVVLSMSRYKGYWALRATPKPQSVLFGQPGPAVSLSTWHERFGHASYDKLMKLIKEESCEGLNASDVKAPEGKCVDCYIGKSKRQAFVKEGDEAKEIGEMIHADISGKFSVRGRSGNWYFSVLRDKKSRHGWVKLIKRKSEAGQHFMEFKPWFERQTGRKIRRYANDKGGEFVSKELREYLSAEGIEIWETNTATPNENGLAERYVGMIKDMATTNHERSGLPRMFWDDAVEHAGVITPLLPTNKVEDGKTPFEIIHNRKPRVSQLRPFGCQAIVYQSKDTRRSSRSKAKGIEGVMIGNAPSRPGYKIYITTSKKVIVSRDVVFNEHVFPYKIMQEEAKAKLIMNEMAMFADAEPDVGMQDVMNEVMFQQTKASEVPLPTSYEEAIANENWKRAIEDEQEAMRNRDVFRLMPLPTGRKALKCDYVYKAKANPDGSVSKYKARLVAKGYDQVKGIDYVDTFAPVAKLATLRLLIALKVIRRYTAWQRDVKTAFLYADLKEDVYIQQPKGMEDDDHPDWVWKLNKSIYGLKQASLEFYKHLVTAFLKGGFEQCKSDPCLLKKVDGDDVVFVAFHVDDIPIVGSSTRIMLEADQVLKDNFTVEESEFEWMLGINMKWSPDGGVHLSQESFVEMLLTKFHMTSAKGANTPMQKGETISARGSPRTDDERIESKRLPYRELVGSLLYLTGTRPDIAFVVGRLCRFMGCYGANHYEAAKRVLRYLKTTKDMALKYPGCEQSEQLKLIVDSDHAGCPDTGRSTTGYMIKFGECMITWKSVLQKTVALSTTEAEYMALCSGVRELLWVKQVCEFLQVKIEGPIAVFTDNTGAMAISNHQGDDLRGRTKHMNVRYHFTKEQVHAGTIKLHHVPSTRNVADILTKPLTRDAFEGHRAKIPIDSAGECQTFAQ
ncbi:unnamed protein product (mitochondrion) [Plasmodiophora brassicae]|uniref:Integrase catalytic domain-containing protein n=1 Tax=Plasmodiophora brassicae TaxID=37360 RepID=A0A3P3YJ98_PLABS|nr:unnamed protein product [Plasmodiophora brassicae]